MTRIIFNNGHCPPFRWKVDEHSANFSVDRQIAISRGPIWSETAFGKPAFTGHQISPSFSAKRYFPFQNKEKHLENVKQHCPSQIWSSTTFQLLLIAETLTWDGETSQRLTHNLWGWRCENHHPLSLCMLQLHVTVTTCFMLNSHLWGVF